MKTPFFNNQQCNVVITLLSFQNDANDLLDFEHKKFEKRTLVIRKAQQDGILFLVKTQGLYNLIAKDDLEKYLIENPSSLVCLKLSWANEKCTVSSPFEDGRDGPKCSNIISDQLWRRIYGRLNGCHAVPMTLKEGDRIQLGRVGLVVRYLAQRKLNSLSHLQNLITEDSLTINDSELEPESTHVIDTQQVESLQENDPKVCRICLCDDDSSGPLVVPCKCKGSMRYVHLECIRTWIKGRLKMFDCDGTPSMSFFLHKLECELCGEQYPSYIDIDNKETDFMGLDQPDPPFAVLQLDNSSDAGCFIISLNKKPSLIGRGHDCDVRLADISVSRLHAMLYFSRGHFVIEDKRSKFGTLVENAGNFTFTLEYGIPISIKIDSDLICIAAKPPFFSFLPCCLEAPRRRARFII
ncbi:bifunctional SMAD-FHA domain superfamily/Forkhead-associated (FHA) domain/Zinc finger [Babesia duncani]|uniref:Bifunctional SMAD-FHA domain superfamily/Forkhead-associated (FHA) domain/Zinc finger n=1 Tax=Babesia duncani TaxID=323732 RepID=A0AAD9PNX7_9APIC|nr:bifunctional SMAD-FHA domain superfamily/Forkhead-associated (FHA) domain/Zinc finger [Babesia duncani]